MSVSCRTYWYSLFVTRPPMRIAGRFCRKTRVPGTPPTFGRRPWITSSTFLRSLRGFRLMTIRPMLSDGLNEVAPMKAFTDCTFGSLRMMSATCRVRSDIASNEMSCAASTKPKIWPLSSEGRNPLGIFTNRNPVATTMARNAAMVARGRAMIHLRLTS